MVTDLRGVEDAFFAAMENGYAASATKVPLVGMPGAKAIPFEFGDYHVTDFYFTAPGSDKSAGQTIIWHHKVPVWTMHYGGWYAKLAIPFLKECMHKAYVTERRFYGGRGPAFVSGERFVYVNHIAKGDFRDFAGEEWVYEISGQCFGHHWYRGMSLLKD